MVGGYSKKLQIGVITIILFFKPVEIRFIFL